MRDEDAGTREAMGLSLCLCKHVNVNYWTTPVI